MSLPRSQHIAVKAGSVEYLSFGGPESAETAVLLHASATGAPMLAGLAERLAKGRRVLVPNLDGYGATKIDCPKCPATFRHVQTVERFLHALKIDDIHLIDHSMGGLIALRVARRARFRLKSLTLIEPMAFGTLDREADREAIAYDRTMIMDFLDAVEAGRLEEGISIFTERVSHQKWTDLSERVQGELLGVLPQIVDEAPLVSCDDLSARRPHGYRYRDIASRHPIWAASRRADNPADCSSRPKRTARNAVRCRPLGSCQPSDQRRGRRIPVLLGP